jgi:hypothetical protein
MSSLGTRPAGPGVHPGLWPGPWPAEDAGPRRTQACDELPPLALGRTGTMETTAVRDALGTTMVILREPGEVYVLRHTLGRRPLEDPVVAWVERLDPVTLEVVGRSPDLESGPFWPGGMAAHANGSLIVVTGNHCHRLPPALEPLARVRLPAPRPYNSFVVLGDGTIATKDFDRELRAPASLTLLDPETLERRCPDFDLGEAAIARLSADGNDIYVVGCRTVMRLAWDGSGLARDDAWGGPYLIPGNSYGWDPVIAGGSLWFMDNGDHGFVTTMRGAGVAPGAVRLIRMSLDDAGDGEAVEVSGLPRGAVTDPPLYDPQRRIAVGYDSANGVVQAFSFRNGRLAPLWRRDLSHSAHMIFYPQTGELVMHDFHGPAIGRTRLGRAAMRRLTSSLHSDTLPRMASRVSRDEVVVLDVETGEELARSPVPTLMQSVVFPAPGFDRDIYWATMSTVARIVVR